MFNTNTFINFIIIWQRIWVYVITVDDERLFHCLDAFTMCSLVTFLIATHNLARLQNCEERQLTFSCLFVHLSVLTEQSGCHWTDFLEISYWVFFENLSRNFKIHLNITRITCTLHEDQNAFLIMYHSFLHRRIVVSNKICRESQNTFYTFFLLVCAICEIIWKILEPDSPRMAMWLMRIACWIPKDTNALSEYVIPRINRSSTAKMLALTPEFYVTRTQPVSYYIPFAKSYTTRIVSKRDFTLAIRH
jgi:hypothetical protein